MQRTIRGDLQCFTSFLLRFIILFKALCSAALAQLVEQFIRNEKVTSSNPVSGTIVSKHLRQPFWVGVFVCTSLRNRMMLNKVYCV